MRAIVAGLLIFITACGTSGDPAGPPTEAALPGDSTAITDTTPSSSVALLDTRSSLPGIVFATDGLDNKYFDNVHNGSKRGGGLTTDNILPLLSDAKARGGRIVLKLTMGRDSYIQNSDGTFSFTKWKSLVDRFKSVNLGPYIADGTILGHFLIDEPHRAAKWGGKIIPQATVEAMAQYSKQIWPTMNTFVHTKTAWLASTSLTYNYLDASWVQYAANKGDVTQYIGSEISSAKSKGLGLMVGLNALDGGNGSSGSSRMSASELKTYGSALLAQSYACGFILWAYDLTYYGRSDVRSAMSDLSSKAKDHVKTSCRQ